MEENGTANPTYADEKTGGNFGVATPLQRPGYTINQSNGRSTFTKGNTLGGRRPVVVEMKAKEFILRCVDGQIGLKKLVQKIYAQAMKGNFRAQELLLNYILGRPTEKVKIESANSHDVVVTPIVKIIADHLRLDKLNKDVDNAPAIVDVNRVEEMEAVLNGAINGTPTRNEEVPPKAHTKKVIVKSKKKQKKKR